MKSPSMKAMLLTEYGSVAGFHWGELPLEAEEPFSLGCYRGLAAGTEGDLKMRTAPWAPRNTMSGTVPPTSTPTRSSRKEFTDTWGSFA